MDSGSHSPNTAADDFTLIGTWQGELVVNLTVGTAINETIIVEFTDTEVMFYMFDHELFRMFYHVHSDPYIDNDQTLHQMDIRFGPIDPRIGSFPGNESAVPAIYESDGGVLRMRMYRQPLEGAALQAGAQWGEILDMEVKVVKTP